MPYVRRKSRRNYGTRMPKRSNRRTRKSARFNARRSGPYRSLRTKWENPIHQTSLVKFNYIDNDFTFTLQPGIEQIYAFSGNAPYDPDYTGVGVQPYGYDQLMGPTALYYFGNCFGSKASVYFHTTAEVNHLRVILVPMRTTGPANTDPSDMSASPYVRQSHYNSQDGTKGCSLTSYASTRQMVPEMHPKSDGFYFTYNGTPVYRWWWLVYMYIDPDGSVDTEVNFDVKVTYYCRVTRYGTTNES